MQAEENFAEAALLDQIQLLSSEVVPADELGEDDAAIEEELLQDPGTPLENEYPLEVDDDSEDEDDFRIIIDDTRTNVTFRAPGSAQRGGAVGIGGKTQKLDIDATSSINGAAIYDLDLASLEDKPWRKPGADLTDYFNYGFTEETWLMYCERQRKLRAEFGMLANRQLFSQLTGIPIMPTIVEKVVPRYTPAQQIPTTPSSFINNLEKFTPSGPNQPINIQQQPPLIMRTVLTVPQTTTQNITPVVPTPAVPAPTQPQQVPTITSNMQSAPIQTIPTLQQTPGMLSQSPPDSPGSTPPPSSGGGHYDMPPGVQTSAAFPVPNMSMPPPQRFPPTNINQPPPSFPPGLPPTNLPPPMFGHPPPGMGHGVPLRYPPPAYGFPPPSSRPRVPHVRHSFRAGFTPSSFESNPRGDDARSPASYSDKSSDEDNRGDRHDRHRRYPAGDRHRRPSRSPSSSSRSRYSNRDRDRDRPGYRGGRYRSRSPVDRSHHDDRKEGRRSGEKRIKIEDDDSHKKFKKRKIKEEPLDEEELERSRGEKSSKKSKDKDDKDRSSSSKKRKKSKDRQESEHRPTEEESQKA